VLKQLITFTFLGALSFGASAASIDGIISSGEYQWTTDGSEGSEKWDTHRVGRSGQYQEYNDASGGDRWDINFLGTNITDNKFQFGALGGRILSGRKTGTGYDDAGIYLSDFALGFNTSSNPTVDSSGFQYAIRVMGVNHDTNEAKFKLLSGGTWVGADIYNNTAGHTTATYKMKNATKTFEFEGSWSRNGGDENVLEGMFDLSLLTLFDLNQAGTLSTYLTMACVNDEAMVHAKVSAVPLPAAVWLLSPALVGFMSLRRRKRKA